MTFVFVFEMEAKEVQDEKIEIALDSEEMNAELALFGGDKYSVKLPVPEAKAFNNLAEYYSKTFAKKIESTSKLKKECIDSIYNRFSKWKPEIYTATEKREVQLTSVFDKMQFAVGPLCILHQSLCKPVRIMVRRRKNCLLREERFGFVTGTLEAFDKHTNLALKNVCEEFVHRNASTNVKIKKHSKQLFIRGDNIVLVCKIEN